MFFNLSSEITGSAQVYLGNVDLPKLLLLQSERFVLQRTRAVVQLEAVIDSKARADGHLINADLLILDHVQGNYEAEGQQIHLKPESVSRRYCSKVHVAGNDLKREAKRQLFCTFLRVTNDR